jgi:methylphosphotriester-DNA--protein-cysteine methyltransferase
MDGQTICEVMLYSYKDLEEKCNGLEYKIRRLCERSMHAGIHDTFSKAVTLINEKIAYCNVKVIIDEAVEKIGDSKALKEYYFKNRDIKAIAYAQSLKVAQAVELIEKQEQAVYKAILKAYSTERLLDIISDSRWLCNKCVARERERNGSI